MERITQDEFKKRYGEVGIQAFSNPVEQTPEKPGQGVFGRVSDVISSAGQKAGQAIRGEGQFSGQSPITRGFEATAEAFKAVPQTFNAVSPEPIRKATEFVGEKVGRGFDVLTDKIASTKLFSDIGKLEAQGFINPQDNPEFYRLKEQLSTAQAIGETAGVIAGAKGTVDTLQGLTNVTKKVGTKLGEGITSTTQKLKESTANTIDDFGSRISSPTVTGATRVSLNPKEALKGTGQDMTVSIGGKLKKLSEVTPSENTKMQFSTQKSINKFTEQAKKFKNNRNPVNDPTEIVGKRVDAALNFADKKRQVVGRKMGEIELKYANEQLPIGNKTIDNVSTLLKDMEQPRFGVDSADAPIVKKLTADFFELENNGAPIADRMEFIRSWDKYLNDAKDPFGNFKENATVNTRIQNAVKSLKNETVDAISAKDKIYRGLRKQYSVYKELDKTGNRLLGKEGLLGDRIKGGSTVKRAIKSNSDAGARQFLTQLKELTGYDAIKDGDLALTAMENVGDYQGLSLLEVLKEGKTGIVGKGLEKIQTTLVGDEAARVNKFIKQGTVNPKLLIKKKINKVT